jgi:hypothetical protein
MNPCKFLMLKVDINASFASNGVDFLVKR